MKKMLIVILAMVFVFAVLSFGQNYDVEKSTGTATDPHKVNLEKAKETVEKIQTPSVPTTPAPAAPPKEIIPKTPPDRDVTKNPSK